MTKRGKKAQKINANLRQLTFPNNAHELTGREALNVEPCCEADKHSTTEWTPAPRCRA